MRSSVLLVGTAAAALVVGLAAPAQAAPQKFEFFEEITDTDFCGLGATVEVVTTAKGVDFENPGGGAEFASVSHGTTTFTYETDTGSTTVILHFAGRFVDTVVSGDPEGVHVHAFTSIGLPEQIRLARGPLLSLDAGSITFFVEFDGDEFVRDLGFTFRGPHPQAESDFELFCQIVPDALGIV